MKLWITAILLTFVVACGPGADLVGRWDAPRLEQPSGSYLQRTIEFRMDGTASTISLGYDAQTQCRPESEIVAGWRVVGSSIQFTRPTSARERQTGCTSTVDNRDWQRVEISIPGNGDPPPMPFVLTATTLTLSDTIYTRVE